MAYVPAGCGMSFGEKSRNSTGNEHLSYIESKDSLTFLRSRDGF